MKHKNVPRLDQKMIKNEIKHVIKSTFDEMLQDVIRGKVSITDFTQKVNYNCIQKKIELQGSLF